MGNDCILRIFFAVQITGGSRIYERGKILRDCRKENIGRANRDNTAPRKEQHIRLTFSVILLHHLGIYYPTG